MSRIGAGTAICLLLIGFRASLSQQAVEPSKVKALLIGEAAYRSLSPCPTSKANVQALADSLDALHYGVTVALDVDYRGLAAAVEKFQSSLQKGDVALVYFSGNAVQRDRDNYLIPIDFSAEKGDLDTQAYSLGFVEGQLKDRGTESRLLILDAARENPAVTNRLFLDQGLTTAYSFSSGTLLALSASVGKFQVKPGQRPIDRFTQALADRLRDPGLTPEDLFQQVRLAVSQNTDEAQVPVVNSLLSRPFYLTGVPKKEVAALPAGDISSNSMDKQEYVWIPPGTFQMGCVPGDSKCRPDESPRHKVTISKGYWMGRTEVEIATYKTYVSMNKGVKMPKAPQNYRMGWNNESQPMVEVTQQDAAAFCKWAGGRLPTEAEWERAARAGVEGGKLAWGDALSHDKANYFGTGGHDIWEDVSPVRKFDPNAWKLYDMSGNVWEWCSDWYDPGYYAKSPEADPTGPPTGKDRVKRGGSFHSQENELRLSYRAFHNDRDNNTGFRCVLDNPPK
ncbi:MAG TPA: SUMF1/EgtB/PvdO family nonheme iron enzyme [Bryobacteraceae bacterium]|nr:SUMF1/EgtB/PvdO family nonheme iron enzyme [Bryobacteraceae bacterium]